MISIEEQIWAPETTRSSGEEFEALQGLFCTRLQREREQLIRLGAALRRVDGDASIVFDALRLCAHRMHGAAAMFLYKDVARAADALEQASCLSATRQANKSDPGVGSALATLVDLLAGVRKTGAK
jgi:HPt (histidine-containing phosphotransfer) domain-containing protein